MKKLYSADREIKLYIIFQVQKINLYLAVDVVDYDSKIKVQVSPKEFSIISKGNKNSLPNCSICKIFQPIFSYTFYLSVYSFVSHSLVVENVFMNIYGKTMCLHILNIIIFWAV